MRKTVWIKGFVCMLAVMAALFSFAMADEIPFTSVGSKYVVTLPDDWFCYSSDLGGNSPLCIATDVSADVYESYIRALDTQVVGLNISGDEIYISVRDRAEGLGKNPTQSMIKAYYDGGTIARGKYTQEMVGGRLITRFPNNPNADGKDNEYLSYFSGSREIIVRWVSADKKTDKDLKMLYEVILSVKMK